MSKSNVFDLLDKKTSRRRFLREGGIAAFAAGVVTACKGEPPMATVQLSGAAAAGATGGTMGAHDTVAGAAAALANADAMDAMHEMGIKAFPAKTAVWG